MALRLMDWTWCWLRRKVGLYGMACLALTFAGITTVILNLASIVRGLDDEVGWLNRVALSALVFGWWAGRRGRNAWAAWTAGLAAGAGAALLHAGHLWPAGLAMSRSLGFLLWSLLDRTTPAAPALASLSINWVALVGALAATVNPFGAWLQGIRTGQPAFDPLVTAAIWGVIFGCLAFWAGWSLRRFERPLPALLPAGALLAGSFSYVRQETYIGLAGFAGIALLLIGINRQYFRERKWQQSGMDYAEDLRVDALFSASALTVVIVILATMTPAFSLRQIADFLFPPAAAARAARETGIGESLGFDRSEVAPGPFERSSDGGLPRRHLLGSGPELTEQVVMVIEVDDPAASPATRYYWRSLTYDTYTGSGWLTGETVSVSYREGAAALESGELPPRVVRQRVRLLENLGGFIFAAGDVVTLDWPYAIAWRLSLEGEARLDQFGGRVSQDSYQVDSLFPLASEAQLRAVAAPLPEWVRARYLSLPEGISPRVFEVAAAVTMAQPTAFDRAAALERYLRSFSYSLDLPAPPADQDIVDYFLFDLRRGYCDYYATAMVVLARAAGLPARLAVGYASGAYDEANDRYVVTAADAHSWVEIYFSGIGWVVFEPTAGQPALMRTETLSPLQTGPGRTPVPFTPLWLRAAERVGWVAGWLTLAALVGLSGWGLVDAWRLRRLPPKEAVAKMYARLRRAGRRLGVATNSGDTPYEFAEAFNRRLATLAASQGWVSLAEAEVQALTDCYVRAAYAPSPLDEADRAGVRRIWRRLSWRLWWAGARAAPLLRWRRAR